VKAPEKEKNELDVVLVAAMEKLQHEDIRVHERALVIVQVPDLKVAKCRLHRRLPKRGFTNIFKKEYNLITLDQLNTFDIGSVVDYAALVLAGFVRKGGSVKILANGDLTKSLIIKIDKISQGAKEKIVAAGGSIEE
jgi:large subunit ribosomal protein L15